MLAESNLVSANAAIEQLKNFGCQQGDHLAVAFTAETGLGLAYHVDLGDPQRLTFADGDPSNIVQHIEDEIGPRWVWWDRHVPDAFAVAGVNVDRCWDILTVHRLLNGGWETSVAVTWAMLHDLSLDALPKMGQLGLLDRPTDEGDNRDEPIRPDGHLRPEWIHSGWSVTAERLSKWAELALTAARLQLGQIANCSESPSDQTGSAQLSRLQADRTKSAAHSESAAELLCAELAYNGLPTDELEATRIIEEAAGPRPRNFDEEDRNRHVRDEKVLQCLEVPRRVNLRNPAEVKSMLRSIGLDLKDTRASRLEAVRDSHPVVEALLEWRKAERIATTYGYRWLDSNVSKGRLRGDWSSSDGAAGRMTASAGLHNLPSEMRTAVAAEPGAVFIRADLGQIEPRVLAAVSGDQALIAATQNSDLYEPVAQALRVEREIAKLAVLGAMYGSTTGESAHALARLHDRYPVAMALLDQAAADGAAGRDVFTVGGRRIKMSVRPAVDGDIDGVQSAAAARGRYARNAIIQGAAAEFFKVWAVIVRKRCRAIGGLIVLCLHDELIVQIALEQSDHAAAIVTDAIAEAAHYWSPAPDVRFVADVSTIKRWSEAKG